MGLIYAIEHMEEDSTEQGAHPIPPWVELEYLHMRTLAGPDAHIHFTNLSKSSCDYLDSLFNKNNTLPTHSKLAHVSCHQESILDLLQNTLGIPNSRVCLLDPKAELPLSPEDGYNKNPSGFQLFLFGGILGDDPPRDRTAELRILGFPSRHLGPVQMTTDTALGVVARVASGWVDGEQKERVRLEDDFPTIRFNARESVEMPFRYIIQDNKNPKKGSTSEQTPLLPPGMREHLHADLDRGFEF